MNSSTLGDWIRGFLMELGIPVKGNCCLIPGGGKTAVVISTLVNCGLVLGTMATENGSFPQIFCFVLLIMFWIFLGGAYLSGKRAEQKQEKPLPINEAYLEIVKRHDYLKLPEFPYMPHAYKIDIITKKRHVCDCCEKTVTHIYDGGLYSVHEVTYLCPWCIASGAAAMKYNGTFNEFYVHVSPDIDDIVSRRTPAISGWQDVQWETCCNDAMLYLEAIGTKKALEKYRGNAAFENEIHDFEPFPEFDQLQTELPDKGQSSLLVHVFQCRHCGKYKLNFDAD